MRNTLFTPDDAGARAGTRGRPVSRPSVYRETSRVPQMKAQEEGTPDGTPEGSPRNSPPAQARKDIRNTRNDDRPQADGQPTKDIRRQDGDAENPDNPEGTLPPQTQVLDSAREKRPLDSQRETKDKKAPVEEKGDGPKSSRRPKSEKEKESAKSQDKPAPSKKPEVETNPELKLNTTVRDWQVNIQEVRVTNMLSDPQSIFLVFKIGDSFKKVDTLTENGKLITIDTGKRGITFVSEIQDNINRDDSRLLTVTIRASYRGSYADLQKEDLVISAWKYSTWFVNTYCGEVRIPLIKVVTENVCRADEIRIKHEGRMKKSLRVNYRCYFQEIWNYKLTFSDFKITNLQHNDGKPYSTNVEFALTGGGTFSLGKSVKTDTIKQDKNPLWETIKGEITYKGPLYELEDRDIDVVIRDTSGLKKGPVCSSRISLKGISTKGSLRVPVKVTLSTSSGNKTEVRGTRGATMKDPRETAGKKRGEDDEIGMDFYYTYLEGRVTIPEKPKYFQKGDSLILRAGGRYLCVQVGKLENIHPPETIGMVNSFVTVHWGNQRNSTRTVMDDFSPTFNEEMHFKISMDKDERDPKFYEELKNYLKSKAEITAYVWLDPKNGGFENIGYCKCTLAEIAAGFMDEKGFYDFENKAQVKKNCRVATVKKQVISSIVESSNTFLNLSFYLFPDYPQDKLDVAELTKVEGDKVDPLVYKAIKDGVSSEPWKTHTSFISQVFGEDLQTFREQNFQFIFAIDQCNMTRFLPTYLDTFTMDYQPPKAPEYELSQVVTCKDVFSFVNNIPFVDEYKKTDLIASPEFTLTQNKGSQADHVVLLACLMMGCTYESQDEIGKLKQLVETYSKEMVSFENRVFVCVGTNKFSNKRELWLMTYSRDLTSVTMWDVRTALCYELKGRVGESNAKLLKKYLTYDPSKDLENNGEAILEILNKLAQEDAQEDEKPEEEESEQSSLKFDLDQLIGQDNYEAIVDPELNRQLYRFTALEREERGGGGFEFMQNKGKSQTKGQSSKNREAIHDFFQKGKKVNSAEMIPWESIELIFNHKNIWANVQYMNPTKIMYEIYNPSQWRCFLSIYNGKNELPWLNKVGAFHNIPALEAPIDPEDIHRYEAIIMKDIKFTITQQRSALNKETRFRSPKDKLSSLLGEYLKVMHVFECSKKSEKHILEDGETVARKMKELIPRDFKLCYLPLRFSILDTERIQSIIAENFSEFFMQVKDPCMFAAACKIFPFPNKINSLRIIICSVSKITKGEFDLSEEEADDLDDETKWELGKTTDLGLKDEHFYHETK